jgi:hypothetical protein
MSIFNDLDVASASDNPFYKDDGTYTCVVSGAEIKTAKKNGDKGLALKYSIVEGEKKGQFINEWKPIPFSWNLNGYPTADDEKNTVNYDAEIAGKAQRSLSFLKARLKDFGFAPEKMNTLEPKDFLELPKLLVTIKNENDRENVKGVELAGPVASAGKGKADPFKK